MVSGFRSLIIIRRATGSGPWPLPTIMISVPSLLKEYTSLVVTCYGKSQNPTHTNNLQKSIHFNQFNTAMKIFSVIKQQQIPIRQQHLTSLVENTAIGRQCTLSTPELSIKCSEENPALCSCWTCLQERPNMFRFVILGFIQ